MSRLLFPFRRAAYEPELNVNGERYVRLDAVVIDRLGGRAQAGRELFSAILRPVAPSLTRLTPGVMLGGLFDLVFVGPR